MLWGGMKQLLKPESALTFLQNPHTLRGRKEEKGNMYSLAFPLGAFLEARSSPFGGLGLGKGHREKERARKHLSFIARVPFRPSARGTIWPFVIKIRYFKITRSEFRSTQNNTFKQTVEIIKERDFFDNAK